LAPKKNRKNHYRKNKGKKPARGRIYLIQGVKISIGIFCLLLFSTVLVLGYDIFTQTGYFNAKYLNVSGFSKLTRHEVLKQAGLQKGVNILAVNLGLTRKKLLAHPWIIEAQVIRQIPDTVKINIKEHEPLAILDLGRKYLLNINGEIFKRVCPDDPVNLPVVSGLGFVDLTVNGQLSGLSFKAIMDVLKLGQNDQGVLPNRLISHIKVDHQMGLTIFAFEKNKIIKLGYNNYKDKYQKLQHLLIYFNQKPDFGEYHSIDLVNLNRIVVTPVAVEVSTLGKPKEV